MPFFKDFHDSGFPAVWFSLAANTLITAAAMVVWREGSFIAGIFAFISYISLATLTTHGTRKPYEYLKKRYVYPNAGKWHSYVFDFVFFSFRAHIIFAPIILVWWAYTSGKVPI